MKNDEKWDKKLNHLSVFGWATLFILSSQDRIFVFYKILVVKSYFMTWADLIKLYHCSLCGGLPQKGEETRGERRENDDKRRNNEGRKKAVHIHA